MTKVRRLICWLTVVLAAALVAGCGSSDKTARGNSVLSKHQPPRPAIEHAVRQGWPHRRQLRFLEVRVSAVDSHYAVARVNYPYPIDGDMANDDYLWLLRHKDGAWDALDVAEAGDWRAKTCRLRSPATSSATIPTGEAKVASRYRRFAVAPSRSARR